MKWMSSKPQYKLLPGSYHMCIARDFRTKGSMIVRFDPQLSSSSVQIGGRWASKVLRLELDYSDQAPVSASSFARFKAHAIVSTVFFFLLGTFWCITCFHMRKGFDSFQSLFRCWSQAPLFHTKKFTNSTFWASLVICLQGHLIIRVRNFNGWMRACLDLPRKGVLKIRPDSSSQ